MDQRTREWSVRVASALCAASRWSAICSLLLTIAAFSVAAGTARSGAAAALLGSIVVAGAAQVYLAVRIEFDRRILELIDEEGLGFAAFDEALTRLGLARKPAPDRSPEERAAGVARLIGWSGALLGMQLLLALIVLALPR